MRKKPKTYYMAMKYVLGDDKELLEEDIALNKFKLYLVEFVDDEAGDGIMILKKKICKEIDELWSYYKRNESHE